MKGFLSSLVLLQAALWCTSACADNIPSELRKSVYHFDLLDATLSDGALRLVVNRPVVNQDVYKSMIRLGACHPLWAIGPKGWGRAKIDRIEVVNSIQHQGLAFVGGRKSCAELGKINDVGNTKRDYFAAHTWVCVAGAPCRERRPGEVISGDD